MSKDEKQQSNSPDKIDRRKFIGVAAATAGAMLIKPALVHGTAANSAVRVGLLGCGGRGTEDATNLVDTGGARVVALGDLFRDQLDTARAHFDKIQQDKGYAAIDASQLYENRISRDARSWMNVTFTLKKPELDAPFLVQAAAAGLHGLKGHRVLGGMRASIYNAMPLAGVEALIAFMREFERQHA